MTIPCSASIWGCYQPHQLPSLMAYCTSSVSRLKNGLPLRTEVPICKLSRFVPPKIDLLLNLDVDLGLYVPLLFLDSLQFVVFSFQSNHANQQQKVCEPPFLKKILGMDVSKWHISVCVFFSGENLQIFNFSSAPLTGHWAQTRSR